MTGRQEAGGSAIPGHRNNETAKSRSAKGQGRAACTRRTARGSKGSAPHLFPLAATRGQNVETITVGVRGIVVAHCIQRRHSQFAR